MLDIKRFRNLCNQLKHDLKITIVYVTAPYGFAYKRFSQSFFKSLFGNTDSLLKYNKTEKYCNKIKRKCLDKQVNVICAAYYMNITMKKLNKIKNIRY